MLELDLFNIPLVLRFFDKLMDTPPQIVSNTLCLQFQLQPVVTGWSWQFEGAGHGQCVAVAVLGNWMEDLPDFQVQPLLD